MAAYSRGRNQGRRQSRDFTPPGLGRQQGAVGGVRSAGTFCLCAWTCSVHRLSSESRAPAAAPTSTSAFQPQREQQGPERRAPAVRAAVKNILEALLGHFHFHPQTQACSPNPTGSPLGPVPRPQHAHSVPTPSPPGLRGRPPLPINSTDGDPEALSKGARQGHSQSRGLSRVTALATVSSQGSGRCVPAGSLRTTVRGVLGGSRTREAWGWVPSQQACRRSGALGNVAVAPLVANTASFTPQCSAPDTGRAWPAHRGPGRRPLSSRTKSTPFPASAPNTHSSPPPPGGQR